MNRKWQRDALPHFSTVEPIHTFMERLPPLTNNLGVASDGDVYSTYSQLHSKGRNPQLLVSQSGGFYYFLADAPQEPETGNLSRLEAVVPVNSNHPSLTLDLLQQLFQLDKEQHVRHILLAVSDADGSVTFMRLFEYIQPPFEGPETLPPLEFGQPAEDSE